MLFGGRWGAAGGASARDTGLDGAVGGVQPRGEGVGARCRARGGGRGRPAYFYNEKKKCWYVGKVTKVMKRADYTFELYYADEYCKAINTIDPSLYNSLRPWATRSRRRGAGAHSRRRPRQM